MRLLLGALAAVALLVPLRLAPWARQNSVDRPAARWRPKWSGPKHELCFVVVLLNMQAHIRPWIEWHRSSTIGGSLFLLFDDGSADGTRLEVEDTPGVLVRSAAGIGEGRYRQQALYQ